MEHQGYTDPWKDQRWDQVPRRVSIPCWSVTPAVSPDPSSWMRSYPLSKSVCQAQSNYWYEKCQTTYGSMIVCNYELDHCNGHRTCETPTSNETLEIPVLSTCLSVVYPDLKTARMWSRPLHIYDWVVNYVHCPKEIICVSYTNIMKSIASFIPCFVKITNHVVYQSRSVTNTRT